MNEDVTVAILAGGQSTRMGRDKSFVELTGKPLIARVIEEVNSLALPIIIIANQPETYQVLGLPVFTDVLPDRSSLAGLYSAVYHSPTDYTLCVACDMPFLNPPLLDHLLSLRTGYDAVVPMIGGHPQGLHALYRKTCLPVMLKRLEKKHLRIRDLVSLLNTCWVDEDTLRNYDPHLDSFINVNNAETLAAAEAKPNHH